MCNLWFKFKYSLIEFSEEETLMSQGPFQFPMNLKDKTVIVVRKEQPFNITNSTDVPLIASEKIQIAHDITPQEVTEQEEKYDLLPFSFFMDFRETFVNDHICDPLKIVAQTFSDQLLQKTENQQIIPVVQDSFITRIYLIKKIRKYKLLKLFYWFKWIEPEASIWYRYWVLGRVGKLVSIT